MTTTRKTFTSEFKLDAIKLAKSKNRVGDNPFSRFFAVRGAGKK
jgi:hypothetical protein